MIKYFFIFLFLFSFNSSSAELSSSEWKKFDEIKHNTIDYWVKAGFEILQIKDGAFTLIGKDMGIIICRVYYDKGNPLATQCFREVFD